jgi:hypothetical protein
MLLNVTAFASAALKTHFNRSTSTMRFHIRWNSIRRLSIPAQAQLVLTGVALFAAVLAGEAGKRWN